MAAGSPQSSENCLVCSAADPTTAPVSLTGTSTSSKDPRSVSRSDALRSQLVRFFESEHRHEQQPTAGETVECRELLGEEDGISARDDEVCSELESRHPTGGDAERGDRVCGGCGDDVGHPDRVVAEVVEGIDRVEERAGFVREPCADGARDADLVAHQMFPAWSAQ